MGISQRPAENAARIAARAEADRLRADAVAIVRAWNERLAKGDPLLFVPTIRAALMSGHHWMQVHCPGCDVVTDVDLRVVPRNPNMGITEIIPALACNRCRGRGPMPSILRMATMHRPG